jgi:hypothetical protein
MGATLRYAKVVDRESFQRSGGQIRPSLESGVQLSAQAPAAARPFYVLRAWDRFDAFTETWRILDPHGRTVHDPVSREVIAEHGDIADEVEDQVFEYADAGYQLVLDVDGREVARAEFPVDEPTQRPEV